MTRPQMGKIVASFDEEFSSDLPAFSVEVISSNPNIIVDVERSTPFTIKFDIYNNSSDHQLVSGSVADEKENLLVFGKTLHEGSESKVSRSIRNDIINNVEVSSNWIQDRPTAEKIAEWIAGRLKTEKIIFNIDEMVGNPVIEVGDIIKIYNHDIQMLGSKEFVVQSVELNWSDGLTGRIVAVEL